MSTERRALRPTEIRVDTTARTFEAVVVRYGVVDSYDTIFDPGCFTKSLEERMPRITWAHDWDDPIGRYVDYKDTAEALTLIGELDDFDAVPRARQAYAQLQSGTIDQFSVGFHRITVTEDDQGRCHFVEAGLDEVALVLVGAVPGTKLLSVRSAKGGRREVPEEYVIDLAKKVAAGEITKEAAAIAVDLAAGVPAVGAMGPAAAGGGSPASAGESGASADAGLPAEEIDAALATLDAILG